MTRRPAAVRLPVNAVTRRPDTARTALRPKRIFHLGTVIFKSGDRSTRSLHNTARLVFILRLRIFLDSFLFYHYIYLFFCFQVHKNSRKIIVVILYHTFFRFARLILHKVSDNFPSIYTKILISPLIFANICAFIQTKEHMFVQAYKLLFALLTNPKMRIIIIIRRTYILLSDPASAQPKGLPPSP